VTVDGFVFHVERLFTKACYGLLHASIGVPGTTWASENHLDARARISSIRSASDRR